MGFGRPCKTSVLLVSSLQLLARRISRHLMNFWNFCHCLTQFISLILILKSCILLPFSIANNTMLWWITWTCLLYCLWNTGIPVHLERADRQTWSKRHPERKHCSQFFWRIHPCSCNPRSRTPCCHESPSQPAHRAHRAHTSRKSLSRKKIYKFVLCYL